MAAQDGEERLLIQFADVHYFFQAPSPRPKAHRFDKGSYLYLFRNIHEGGGRLQIANNVGRPEVDDFTGCLDLVNIRQSHKHPSLCTITVDGFRPSTPPRSHHHERHWKLQSNESRDGGRTLLKLHTLDIYFWKAEDAHAFISSVSRILQHGQVEILDAPPPASSPEVVASPVVQKLEHLAVKDPAYQNGQTRTSQPTARLSRATSSASSTQATLGRETSPAETPAAFKPMAYNPAAPAAPEPIRHREKTPPPIDAEHGTGLSAAAQHDNAPQYSPMPSPMPSLSQPSLSRPTYGHSPSSQGYVSPPPSTAFSPPAATPAQSAQKLTSPPSAIPGQRTPSVSSIPPAPQSGRTSTNPYGSMSSFGVPPSQRESVSSQTPQSAMSFGPPPKDPNVQPYGAETNPPGTPTSELLGNSYMGGTHQPLQHLQPQYPDYLSSRPQSQQQPVGGYSQYDYSQQPHHGRPGHRQDDAHDIHNQIYRPTEDEAQKQKQHRPSDASKSGRVDKGVNKFLKKLESRLG